MVSVNLPHRIFEKGSTIFTDGSSGDQMYIIQSGSIKIFKKTGKIETTLAVLSKGEFFGEMAILNNEKRSANAESLEDSTLLVIKKSTFETMINSNSAIAIRMIKTLASRLRGADDQIENLMIGDSRGKVLNPLIKMALNEGKDVEEGIMIGFSARDLSIKTGLSETEIEKILVEIRKIGLISTLSDGVVIKDIHKLRRYLAFLTLKKQFE